MFALLMFPPVALTYIYLGEMVASISDLKKCLHSQKLFFFFSADILFCLMKDATSTHIPSTLLGEDTLGYNLLPFLPETHLLCLLSSIQRDAFSEGTGFLPSSWKQHPCSVSAASGTHVAG